MTNYLEVDDHAQLIILDEKFEHEEEDKMDYGEAKPVPLAHKQSKATSSGMLMTL